MIVYRPTDGDVQTTRVAWKPRTCFVMTQMGQPIPADVARAKKRISGSLRRAGFKTVDADSKTTGKDFLLKIWSLALGCPVGIAIIHEGVRPETMANIYYELGWMHAWGRETVVVKVGNVSLPSDLVRTEHIPFDRQFSRRFGDFVKSLRERCDYYLLLADQLEKNPLLAIDYLRRAYLLSGDAGLKKKADAVYDAAGLASRARDSVERLLCEF
jgi:hypothetical protein